MKSSKAPGEDQIVVEMIRARGEIALRKIQLFNAVLRSENAIITLLKKEERTCQLQTYQTTLTYLQFTQEISEEQTLQQSR